MKHISFYSYGGLNEDYIIRLNNISVCCVEKSRFDGKTITYLDNLIHSDDECNHIIAAEMIIQVWNKFHPENIINNL